VDVDVEGGVWCRLRFGMVLVLVYAWWGSDGREGGFGRVEIFLRLVPQITQLINEKSRPLTKGPPSASCISVIAPVRLGGRTFALRIPRILPKVLQLHPGVAALLAAPDFGVDVTVEDSAEVARVLHCRHAGRLA